MSNKKMLSTERKIELENFILEDPFFNENNKSIKYYDEIKFHFKKFKFSKQEISYLIISTIMPLDKFSLDIEKLYNEEYSPSTFLYKMMNKYLYSPSKEREFEDLKEIILYRYDSINEIKKHNKFNIRYKK